MEDNNRHVQPISPDQTQVAEVLDEDEKKKKKTGKEPISKTLIRLLITLVIIALGIFLLLWIVSIAAQYKTIGAMLNDMGSDFGLIIRRITGKE